MQVTTTYYNFYSSSSLFHGSILKIMGTRLDVVIIVEDLASGVRIWDGLVAEVKSLDELLNRFSANSEITKINHQASQQPVAVSDELWEILIDCKLYHKLTLGLFDISLRNFDKVELHTEQKTVFFKNSDINLDFGGFAKGYAIEKLKARLLNEKITQAFINFGNSSIGCIGTHPYGENWSVSVENPFNPTQILGEVLLKDNCLSVSGNTPANSKHIIHPETGKYVEGKKITCISTTNAAIAEVLSTTFLLTTSQEKSVIRENFANIAVYDEKEYYAQ